MVTYILAGSLLSLQLKTSKLGAYSVTGATERASDALSLSHPCPRSLGSGN